MITNTLSDSQVGSNPQDLQRPDALIDVLMDRDGMDEDMAELRIDQFRTELMGLLVEQEVTSAEDVNIVLENARELFHAHFDVESDYLDEFWEEAVDGVNT